LNSGRQRGGIPKCEAGGNLSDVVQTSRTNGEAGKGQVAKVNEFQRVSKKRSAALTRAVVTGYRAPTPGSLLEFKSGRSSDQGLARIEKMGHGLRPLRPPPTPPPPPPPPPPLVVGMLVRTDAYAQDVFSTRSRKLQRAFQLPI